MIDRSQAVLPALLLHLAIVLDESLCDSFAARTMTWSGRYTVDQHVWPAGCPEVWPDV